MNFLDGVSKNIQIPNLMKIRTLGAELFYAGGQTDVTKLIVAFRSSMNASEHYYRMKFAKNV
jgi:hypothetical protein